MLTLSLTCVSAGRLFPPPQTRSIALLRTRCQDPSEICRGTKRSRCRQQRNVSAWRPTAFMTGPWLQPFIPIVTDPGRPFLTMPGTREDSLSRFLRTPGRRNRSRNANHSRKEFVLCKQDYRRAENVTAILATLRRTLDSPRGDASYHLPQMR
jgi:hypothetical protein